MSHGAGRYGVHRLVGIAGFEGQYFKTVPPEYAFYRRQRFLAPIGVDCRRAFARIKPHLGEGGPHCRGQCIGSPLRYFDLAALVGDGGERVSQDDAGIG